MKVNIYYGGRGIIDDPTLYVIEQIERVLNELMVEVHTYNIYEQKNAIPMLPQTLKGVDGIVLATTVEWLGIGGYMSQFLDACWLYTDRETMANIYMQPVVISTTYGEHEAMATLENAWEKLGGLPCSGFCGYVEDPAEFKSNKEYLAIMEKKVEMLYRTISHKTKNLPSSNQAIARKVQLTPQLTLSPKESEQLSKFAADESYVSTQKADIEDLSSIFRDMMGANSQSEDGDYIAELKSHFKGEKGFSNKYLFFIDGKSVPLYVHVFGEEIEVAYKKESGVDNYIRLTPGIMESIVSGRMTVQRAFTMGDITNNGGYKNIYKLDEIFDFKS